MATAVSENARRAATWRRDVRLDGVFVFGVRSTRIYCRPSCPARRPRPDRVVFFDTPEEAERGGFRPCRRCHPRGGASGPNPAAERVAWLCREIDRAIGQEPEGKITLARLGQKSGMGIHAVERIFRKHLGVTPRQYADARRVGDFKARLRKGANVTEALYEAGYGSSSRLYERSASQLGMTPLAYRRGGENVEIRYAVAPCPLGRLLVAATGRGVAAIYLGDSEPTIRRQLGREFPQARIREDRKGLRQTVAAIVGHLGGRAARLDLPLDVRATAFQRLVWEELRRIPYGKTRSYSDIARAIGRPRAARAVARACATNPAAIVIPCHRVVGQNGALTGYRWGLGRKRALLATEKAAGQRLDAKAPRRAKKPRSHQKDHPAKAQVRTIRAKRLAESR